MILPFDSHNHVHLGPSPPSLALLSSHDYVGVNTASLQSVPILEVARTTALPALQGMALMSTHPRDFGPVLDLSKTLSKKYNNNTISCHVIPCFGVHPWFLHELDDKDWESSTPPSSINNNSNGDGRNNKNFIEGTKQVPKWLQNMEELLIDNSQSIVGEIGLDGFHFDSDTGELASPMDKQIDAFVSQMQLASRQKRPVSIHLVQAFGPMMTALSQLKKSASLPPKMYFHAYGGKEGTVDQLLSLCGKEKGRVIFGFAPIVNFRSPKTANVVRKIGIDRIVLESDHEDSTKVAQSIEECIRFLSDCLDIDESRVIEITTNNALEFYNIK